MADNVVLDSMAGGDSVAADDIGGIKFQRVKLIHGADGVNAGDVSTANGLPVSILAGSAAIGKLAANSGVDIGDIDVTSVIPGTGATNLGKAEDAVHGSGDTGVMALGVGNEAQSTRAADGDYIAPALDTKGNHLVVGNVAHDGVDAGYPLLQGFRAIAHGSNPTAVAAADRTVGFANRHGIPFVIGGHMNILSVRANYTAAQTDTALLTVSTGTKIVVTECHITVDAATTVKPLIRVGFGTANTPTTSQIIASHPGLAAGGGIQVGNGGGIIGIGADNEDIRVTCAVPTSGSIDVVCKYFTIES